MVRSGSDPLSASEVGRLRDGNQMEIKGVLQKNFTVATSTTVRRKGDNSKLFNRQRSFGIGSLEASGVKGLRNPTPEGHVET